MTDLRDQLATAIGVDPAITAHADALRIADRLLAAGWRPPSAPRTRERATCHPDRHVEARGLCKPCYHITRDKGELDRYPVKHRRYRSIADVVDLVQLLDGEGATARAMADKLGMTVGAFRQAVRRAKRLGLLAADRRPA